MKNICLLIYLISLVFGLESRANFRFGFGSCHDQNKPGEHFNVIAKESIDSWIWLGDNIYADHFSYQQRKRAYNNVKNRASYQKMIRKMEIWGIWDDHDYAYNNTGANYPKKRESKKLFLDFIGFSPLDPINFREGIYHQKIIEKNGLILNFIFLDLRYFNSGRDLLGEAQWSWLESALFDSESDIIFIVSSLNVLGRPSLFNFFLEGWHRFPREQERLFSLVELSYSPVVFLSGDRHYSERAVRAVGESGRVVFEFMSSGINKPGKPLPNEYRLGEPVSQQNFATIEIYKDEKTERLKILHLIKSSYDGRVISGLETFIR